VQASSKDFAQLLSKCNVNLITKPKDFFRDAMGRAGLNKREALGKVVIAWSPKRVAQLHIPLFQLCKSTGQKRQN